MLLRLEIYKSANFDRKTQDFKIDFSGHANEEKNFLHSIKKAP